MPPLRRYRLMPVAFDTRHHVLEATNPSWEPQVCSQHERNREVLVDRLRFIHGEANLDQVIQNMKDLGSDPFSTIVWHLQLWREVRHTFVSGAYFPAAVGAGALAERVLNHLLIDLGPDCADANDLATINGVRSPTYFKALEILKRWNVLEPEAVARFEALRVKRNDLVHFNQDLYGRFGVERGVGA